MLFQQMAISKVPNALTIHRTKNVVMNLIFQSQQNLSNQYVKMEFTLGGHSKLINTNAKSEFQNTDRFYDLL